MVGDARLRNDRRERNSERRIGLWIASVAGGFLLLCFITPATLEPGMIPELSGRANAIDYWSSNSWGNLPKAEGGPLGHDPSLHGGTVAWRDLPPIHSLVYAFGDLNCHQKHERSWRINDNQMPLCVRDIGMLLGATIGGLLFASRGLNRWTVRDTLLSPASDVWLNEFYARGSRNRLLVFLLGATILPIGLDGGIQLVTSYESNNSLRLITGAIFGLLLGVGISAMFAARPKAFDDTSEVRLPGGARFVLATDEES